MSGHARRVPTGVRVLRGALFATTTAALAVAAHRAAGGAWPEGGTTLVLTVLVAAAATALADRQRHPLAVIATMGGAQVAMHLVLDVAGAHHNGAAAGSMIDGRVAVVAHAGAALLAALVLAKADRCLVAMAAALRAVLPPPLPPRAASVPLGFQPVVVPVVDVTREVLLRRSCARRGPPRSR